MKGWRTIVYNAVSGVAGTGVIAVLLVTDFEVLGFSAQTAGWLALGIKVIDNLANAYLRSITTTPMGKRL
jgi:small basic protein